MNRRAKGEAWLPRWSRCKKCGVAGGIALLLSLPAAALGGGVVSDCTEASLRAAMAGGGTVTFACGGTIMLTGTITNAVDTVLDGSGQQVTISGGNSVRMFYISTNAAFTLIKLTLANGQATSSGAGILNDGGTLTLRGVTMQANTVMYGGYDAGGGAILNLSGTVCATNCTFLDNAVTKQLLPMTMNLPIGRGGAIHNVGGAILLENCDFVTNYAQGYSPNIPLYPPFPGTAGRGGAICNGGSIIASLCRFAGNSAIGGKGGDGYAGSDWAYGCSGGEGSGGALDNAGDLTLLNCSFTGNLAQGGNGGAGTPGRYEESYGGGTGGAGCGGAVSSTNTARIFGCTFNENLASGGLGGRGGDGGAYMDGGGNGAVGGGGGYGRGGAVDNLGWASMVNCSFASNTGRGGNGGVGGNGGGSYLRWGGNGGRGGPGGSGIAVISGTCQLTNCTVAWNQGIAGSGGAGGGGAPALHPGMPGAPGSNGFATGATWSGPLANTLIASNTPSGNDSFADPKLGPLANNGGPTLTMALLPGSPAIDGGDTATAPTTDQRGLPRPVGAAADIGAFEYGSPALLQISRSSENVVEIFVLGVKNQSCRLLTSATLSNWQCVATNQFGPNGTTSFQDNRGASDTHKFYKVALP